MIYCVGILFLDLNVLMAEMINMAQTDFGKNELPKSYSPYHNPILRARKL